MAKRISEPDLDAARELQLFAENDADLYRQRFTPIIANLARKRVKGTYDPEKSAKAYVSAADDAARRYQREFGDTFDRPSRILAAEMLRDSFDEQVRYEADRMIRERSAKKATAPRKTNPVVSAVYMVVIKRPRAKDFSAYWTGSSWDSERQSAKRYANPATAQRVAERQKDEATSAGYQIGLASETTTRFFKKGNV